MDPNANLDEQRDIYRRIIGGSAREGDAERLADLCEALDEWIHRGGALPNAWEPVTS